jgi:hypothetical protein
VRLGEHGGAIREHADWRIRGQRDAYRRNVARGAYAEKAFIRYFERQAQSAEFDTRGLTGECFEANPCPILLRQDVIQKA